MEVLFTLIADRYEKACILLSSNLPFSKWESIFKDPMTTAAAIDRLVRYSMILELNTERAIGRSQPTTRSSESTDIFLILDLFDWGNLIVAKGEN